MSLRMRARPLLLLVLSLPNAVLAQAPARDAAPATGKGIIRGVVTAADTGKPIQRADIRLQSVDMTPVETRSVVTDGKGHYEITGLKAGRYTLSARKPGYLGLAFGQRRARDTPRPVQLSESMPLDKIDFMLPTGSVIVARITDHFGDPVRGVLVGAYQPRFNNGRWQLSTAGGLASVTDDRGETRIFGLAPGEYYVVAAPEFLTQWRGEIETLHPGTLDVAEAHTVRVGIGDEAFVTFPMQRAKPSSLSGWIVGSNGRPLASPTVSLEHPQISGGSARRLNVAPDGSFHEENLAPGDWAIVVNEPEYGSARFRLLGDDLQGQTVTTRGAAVVRGRVTFDGAPPPNTPTTLNVAFEGPRSLVGAAGFVRSGSNISSFPVGPETQWTFEARVSGMGVIRASRTGPWLLKAVLLDGKDVTDTVLDFGSVYGDKPVEVVLTQRRAQLSGMVSNDRGQPVGDYVVVLFPEDEAQWTSSSRFFGTGRPDQEGRFTINTLPPGRYLVTAVESLESGDERDPERLARLRGSATAIALAEGESRSIALRMSR